MQPGGSPGRSIVLFDSAIITSCHASPGNTPCIISKQKRNLNLIYHHPHIPLSGVGTTCFLLPFSSLTTHLHAHSFYAHVILHTVHPSFLRSNLITGKNITYIHTYHSRFIPVGNRGITYIPPDAHVLPKLVSYDECCCDRW
jgi:hypothetical protein